MKTKHDEQQALSRREFLSGTAAVGVGAAIAVSLPGVASAAPEPQAKPAPTRSKGYQETAHVRQYYETLKR